MHGIRKQLLFTMALLAAFNYVVIGGLVGGVPFNVIRVLLALSGGWLVAALGRGSLWLGAFAGVLVLVTDHLVLKGGYYLLAHWLWPEAVDGQGLLAFGGVVLSFVMFAPVAALLGVFGAWLARWSEARARRNG